MPSTEAQRRAKAKWSGRNYDKRERWRKERQAERERAGLCKLCGRVPAQASRKNCRTCLDKARQYYTHSAKAEKKHARDRATYQDRKANGLCVECGLYPPRNKRTRCGKCTDKQNERSMRFLQKQGTKAKLRAWYLRSHYGITPEQWDALFKAQNRCCAICLSPSGRPTWHTDHSHSTGKVRGILCRRCNQAVGFFGDDPILMQRAARYVSVVPESEVRLA